MNFKVLLQAVTPIAHGDTVTGIDNATNTRIFMRQAMMVNGKPGRVPSVSENALRSTIMRATLADHMVSALKIGRGELPQAVMNLLWSGGSMASGSKAPGDEIALGHQIKRTYPILDLLGGAVDGFILPRSRMRLCAWIVAREYADALRQIAPELEEEALQSSAYDMLAEETRTRGTGAESDGNQMLYTYETMAAGTKVLIEVSLDQHTPAQTIGAAAFALSAWDGFIGGQGRQGRGRMVVVRSDFASEAQAYLDHLEEHGAAMRDGLINGTLGTVRVLCAKK